MERELQTKIGWLETRMSEAAKKIEELEKDRQLNRSTTKQVQLRYVKKEKLRMKDQIAWLKKLENQLPKN